MAKYTTAEILNLSLDEFMELDAKSMIQITNKLNSIANKRVRRAQAGGWERYSPAIKSAIEQGGTQNPFSTRNIKTTKTGKYNVNSLAKQFGRVKGFLTLKTSSYKGAMKLKQETYKRIGGGFPSESLETKYWELYNKFLETDAGKQYVRKGEGRGNSTEVQTYLRNIFLNEEGDESVIFEKLARFASGEYEEGAEEYYEDEEDYYDI